MSTRVLEFPTMDPSPLYYELLYQAEVGDILRARSWLSLDGTALSAHERNVMLPAAYHEGLAPEEFIERVMAAREAAASRTH